MQLYRQQAKSKYDRKRKKKKTSSAAVKINPFILYNTYAPNFEVKTINSGERSPSNGPFSLNIYVIKVSEKWNEWTDQSNEFVRVIQGCEFIYNVVIASKRGVKYSSHGRYVLVMFPCSFCSSEKIPVNWQFKVMNLFMEFRAINFFRTNW